MKFARVVDLSIKIILAKILHQKIPIRVKQYVTYRCNLSCVFCARRTVKKPEMTTLQIKEMMKDFKNMGTMFWEFTGGEALLREDLVDLVNYAKDNMNFHLSLITNGTLLAEKISKQPSLKKIDFIQISLDGRKKINDRLRGEGTFDKVIRALDMLKGSNIKIKISTVITNDNLEEYKYLINIAIRYGISIAFEPTTIHPQDKQLLTKQYFPDKEKFREFIDILLKEKQNGTPLVSSPDYLKMARHLWPDGGNVARCYAGKFLCDITPEGYVIPCCVRLEHTRDECHGLKHGFKKAFFNLGDLTYCNLPCFCSGPQEMNIALKMVPLKMHKIVKNYANVDII